MHFLRLFPLLLLLLSACGTRNPGKLRASVKVNDKYGYIDETGKFIVDPKFEDAWSFIRGTAVVREDGKYGLIGKDGDYVLKPQLDSVIPFSASCFIYMQDSAFGFMSHGTANVILKPQFDRVFFFTDELCVVQKGKALGIVNQEGKIVCPLIMQDFRGMFGPAAIALQTDTTDEVSMMLALIQGTGQMKYGLVSRKGELIVTPEYDDMFDDLPNGYYYPFIRTGEAVLDSSFVEGPAPVPPGKYGIIDTTGKLIAKPQFDELPVYGDGMFRVRSGEKYGYVDAAGKMVIAPAYEFATAFSEGKAIVSIGSVASIIDKTGKILSEDLGPGSGMYRFKSGLARCRSMDGRYGFLDANGKRVIMPQFEVADDFENNRAIVQVKNKYGLIDRAGNFVVQPQYEFIFNLGEGYYQAKDSQGRTGVVDSTGKVVLEPRFEEIFHLQKPYFTVELNQLNGCYSVSGKEIYPPVSSRQIYFYNGRCEVTDAQGKCGLIDSTGKILLPTAYDSIGTFFKGYATIMQAGRFGAIDTTGKIVVAPKYEELRPMVNGFAVYREKRKFGYIPVNGSVAIPAHFDDASVFVDPDRTSFE
jgi:hypothetical protein